MGVPTRPELEFQLAELEHQLAHLEALDRSEVQATHAVQLERVQRQRALLGEREALQVALAPPTATTPGHGAGWPGLWEPLALHPPSTSAPREPLAELKAALAEDGVGAWLTVRPLMRPITPRELEALFAAAVQARYLEPCQWALTAGDVLAVRVGHVALVSRTLRWLRAVGLAERRVAVLYRERQDDTVLPTTPREVLWRFLVQELEREARRHARERTRLAQRLDRAQALVIGSFLEPVIVRLLIEADGPADERWALEHLHRLELWTRPPFVRLATEAPALASLRAALDAQFPALGARLRQGLSGWQCEALRRDRKLAGRRAQLADELARLEAELAAHDAQDTREVRVTRVRRRLSELAARHGDPRRTRIVSWHEVLSGPS